MKKYVAYYRVSTQKQGASGLGLEAQKQSVRQYLSNHNYDLVAEFTEIETGKGADALSKRPQLKQALELCRKSSATLLIAKLDRLARNVHFVSGLIETNCDFIAVDMPQANKVMLQIHAVMSEYERDQISARTKAALKAAKKKGRVLGKAGPTNLKANLDTRKKAADDFARKLSSVIEGFKASKLNQRQMVEELNQLEISTAKGGTWTLVQLQRVLARHNALQAEHLIEIKGPRTRDKAISSAANFKSNKSQPAA